ncbi:MAG: hypothetical protein AAF600_02680 [Bacteroidota bacterium]
MKDFNLRDRPPFIIQIKNTYFKVLDQSKRNQFKDYNYCDIDVIYFKNEEINVSASLVTFIAHLFLPSGLGFGKIVKEAPRICMTYQNHYEEIFVDNCNIQRVEEVLNEIKLHSKKTT